MAKRIIECTVNDEYIIGGGVPVGAAGSHGDVVLRLAFGEMWAGLNIYATFTDALGQNPTVVLLMPSMLIDGEATVYDVPVPAAAKKTEGRASLSLTGYVVIDGIEDQATNTVETYFRVLPSKTALADDGTIDATLAQQVQDEINQIDERMAEHDLIIDRVNELIDEIETKLEEGEFKGEKGDPGKNAISPIIQLFKTEEGVIVKVINADGTEYQAPFPDYVLDSITRAEEISI